MWQRRLSTHGHDEHSHHPKSVTDLRRGASADLATETKVARAERPEAVDLHTGADEGTRALVDVREAALQLELVGRGVLDGGRRRGGRVAAVAERERGGGSEGVRTEPKGEAARRVCIRRCAPYRGAGIGNVAAGVQLSHGAADKVAKLLVAREAAGALAAVAVLHGHRYRPRERSREIGRAGSMNRGWEVWDVACSAYALRQLGVRVAGRSGGGSQAEGRTAGAARTGSRRVRGASRGRIQSTKWWGAGASEL